MLKNKMKLGGRFEVVARDPDGNIKWVETFENLVTNAGLDYLLDAGLSGGTPITTWYIGLKNAGSVAAGDTMSSHGGWTENQNYDEASRQTWTDGGVSSQSVTNSGSPAVFTIDTNSQTIAGVFLTSSNTKGGTTGTLLAAGDFSAARDLNDNDTLTVTYTFNAADDGA